MDNEEQINETQHQAPERPNETFYRDEVKNKSKINILIYAVAFVTVMLVLFLAFTLMHSKKQRYQTVATVQTIILPWDPIDWHTLVKNPLLYKSMTDDLLEDVPFYEEFLKKPESIDVAIDQKYFDDSLKLIKKQFIRNVPEPVLIASIKSELTRMFGEAEKLRSENNRKIDANNKETAEAEESLQPEKNPQADKNKKTAVNNKETAEAEESLQPEKNPQAGKKFIPDLSGLDINKNFLNDLIARYGQQVDQRVLAYATIIGLFRGIDDPYSFVLGSKSLSDMMERLQDKTFGGIGIVIEMNTENDNMLTIVEPLEGTPAYKAGLHPGDVITKIDGKPTRNVDISISMSRMRGKKGTHVKLEIKRGKEVLEFNIVRDDIKTTSISHKMLPNQIGYIRVRQFATSTVSEFDEALRKLMYSLPKSGDKEPELNGLIVDLRNNGGGLLDAGVSLSSEFLPPNSIVMKKMERGNFISNFLGGSSKKLPAKQIVVLVNRFSASASEIMAGALKDNHAAILLGEKTFGKGSVQQLFERTDGSAIKMTVGYFMSPNATLINKRGIVPDYLKKMEPRKVGKADDIQLKQAEKLIMELNRKSLKET